MLGVDHGDRLLDVACGAGLAIELASVRGADCAGIDASPRLVAVARDRSPAADIRVGDMHALPWDDGGFTVATSFRGIWGTTPAAMEEVWRVLRPGGRIVAKTLGGQNYVAPSQILVVLEHLLNGRLARAVGLGTLERWDQMARRRGLARRRRCWVAASSLLESVPLIDHHCHGITFAELGAAQFDELASESSAPGRPGRMLAASQFGAVVRAECAPLLGLPRHCSSDEYQARRLELGAAEVNRRLLVATGISCYFIDTGYRGGELLTVEQMAEVSGQSAREVVRLEAVAEELAGSDVSAAGFALAYAGALANAAHGAVGLKSIMAYRFGLDFDPDRPVPRDVTRAAGDWLRRCAQGEQARLDDPVLLRHVLWAGVDLGLPLQFHVGFGDSDIVLHRCDPARMTGFIQAVQPLGTQVMLLHCYPYHRQAGYLAHVYPHVWFDTGSAVSHSGLGSLQLIRESLEVAPFDKVLFSTDAFGLAELYLCGALLWRRGLAQVMDEWLARDWLSAADAESFVKMIANDNARRAYGLEDHQ